MSVKPVGVVGPIASSSAPAAAPDLAERLSGVLHSAKLPEVAAKHGMSAHGFKLALETVVQRLLGIDGPAGEQHADGQQALARLKQPFPTDLLAAATKNWKQGIPQRSPEERARLDKDMAAAIIEVQEAFAAKESRGLMRGQHAKGILGLTNARVQVRADLPKELQFGSFQPGADWRTILRFSNAPSSVTSDASSARRGLGLRMTDDKGHSQDMLFTTGSPAFLAKDGVAAVTAARDEAKGVLGLVDMVKTLGAGDAAKLVFEAKTTTAKDESLAASTFFSRVPFQLGDYALKFRLAPLDRDPTVRAPPGDDQLTRDGQARLKVGDVVYVLEAQFNRNPSDMGDARIDWDSPYVPLARLVLPKQDLTSETAKAGIDTVESLSFKPWNRWDDSDDRAMKPLGDVNEARKPVYEADSRNRGSGGVNDHRCPLGYG